MGNRVQGLGFRALGLGLRASGLTEWAKKDSVNIRFWTGYGGFAGETDRELEGNGYLIPDFYRYAGRFLFKNSGFSIPEK